MISEDHQVQTGSQLGSHDHPSVLLMNIAYELTHGITSCPASQLQRQIFSARLVI